MQTVAENGERMRQSIRFPLLPLALSVFLAATWAAGDSMLDLAPGLTQDKAEAQRVADPEIVDGQGYPKLLERHRGKPLMVYFWATWCEPCRVEFPIVNELARSYTARGLVVVGVSLGEDGEMNLVRRFLASLGLVSGSTGNTGCPNAQNPL